MARTAQDVLEFDKLRELLRLRTTCTPGRRAVNALDPGMDRAAAFTRATEVSQALFASAEAAEGMAAFREKRHPSWAPPPGAS